MSRITTAFYSEELRNQWPHLALTWRHQYPAVFDDDDLRQVKTQPTKHFHEWFAALHIYQRTGALSLIEKAQFIRSHPAKRLVVERIMSPNQRDELTSICDSCEVQWPDLLVYRPRGKAFRFVEVKGPTDRLSAQQIRSHERIEARLGVPVHILNLKIGPARPS